MIFLISYLGLVSPVIAEDNLTQKVAPVISSTSPDHLPRNWVYHQLLQDTELTSSIAGKQRNVGLLKQGEWVQTAAGTEYNNDVVVFGYALATINSTHLSLSRDNIPVIAPIGDIHQPLINQLFLTEQTVNIYRNPSVDSPIFGQLYADLRYPIRAKLVNKQGDTWYQIILAGNLGYVRATDVSYDKGVPILTFHHLLKDDENKYFRRTSTTTSDSAFSEQMSYLKKLGYQSLTLDQLNGFLRKQANIPAKAMVITFDDGLKSVYRYAYPELKQLGYHATLFIVSSRIKREPQPWDPNTLQFMSVDELQASRDVFEIQSHSHFLHRYDNHRKPIVFSRSEPVIIKDLERSRRALEQFNPRVNYFAYPFGAYNQRVEHAVENSGIQLAFSTVRGKVKPGDNLYTLKRIYLLNGDPLEVIKQKVAN